MTASDIYTTIKKLDIPCVYSHFKDGNQPAPPYIAYIGAGQNQFAADNIPYHRQNVFQVEFYFTAKDPSLEDSIEEQLITDGWWYEKSEDVYIEDERVFVIYYTVS